MIFIFTRVIILYSLTGKRSKVDTWLQKKNFFEQELRRCLMKWYRDMDNWNKSVLIGANIVHILAAYGNYNLMKLKQISPLIAKDFGLAFLVQFLDPKVRLVHLGLP